MLIVVRQEHINNGERGSDQNCPVARALRDAYFTYDVSVGCRKYRVGKTTRVLPDDVRAQIHLFDSGINIRPFIFSIEDHES